MKTYLLIFLLFISFDTICQSATDTIFYDQDWKKLSFFDSTGFYGFKNYDESKKGMATYYYASRELYSHQNEVADKNMVTAYGITRVEKKVMKGIILMTNRMENKFLTMKMEL